VGGSAPARPLNVGPLSLQTRNMKYDDASWHSEGNFPSDLPEEAAATHSGMFLAWALLRGMVGKEHAENFSDDLKELESRKELNEEGNAFAAAYFDFKKGKYIKDYEKVLAKGLPTAYHVADTWENFDRLRPTLDKRFKAWRSKQG
jgi:hypothetical protein